MSDIPTNDQTAPRNWPRHKTTTIRWGAFIAALILAPLTLAVPAFVLLMIMSGFESGPMSFLFVGMAIASAPIFGAPTYLTLGAYALAHAVKHDQLGFAWLAAFLANLASTPFVWAYLTLTDTHDAGSMTAFIVGFGCIAAPLWGAIFAALYACFSRSTRQTPA